MTKWHGDRPLEVLTLAMQGEMFALEAAYVREILDLVAVTEVPNSDPFVNGLINVRGKVVPLADLRLKFGIQQTPPDIDTRIIVIEVMIDGDSMIVGIQADKVHEIVEIAASALEDTPRIGMRWCPEYVLCIAKRSGDFIVIMDIERILSTIHTQKEPPTTNYPASLLSTV